MSDAIRSWPVGLRRLAEIIGPAAAVRLADAFGGTEDNNVPKRAHVHHPFTAVIGLDRLEALCRAIGPTKIDIPRGTYRDLKKARILESSGTNRQVALGVRCTQRYVRLVRNSITRDPDQAVLFNDD